MRLLRQIEVQMARGKSIAVACKAADVSEQAAAARVEEYGGPKVDPAGKIRDLAREDAGLRRTRRAAGRKEKAR
ncbi:MULTISPECIES: hypothetical protein [Methylobacterium]|uniref:hypothetical protein n=1 Tax=Methylobacterium TaxID=407 RepID=UPI0009EAFAA4|nr:MULTISPECIES: hypothetical protein [Methylobacterium]MCI9881798.1 hypothetical protein [Methylobacterium goesingense]